MRIIRTEFYVSHKEIVWQLPYRSHVNSGVSFAWIKTDTADCKLRDLEDFSSLRLMEGKVNFDEIIHFLECVVQELPALSSSVKGANYKLAEELLGREVVIQSSPPEAIPLAQLLSRASAVSIGTGVGFLVAGGNPLLLIATVPAGIIIVGSAIGISKGLENGLRAAVERWIKKATK